MPYAGGLQPLTTDIRVRSHANTCGPCAGRSGIGRGVSSNTVAFHESFLLISFAVTDLV
jgi:hypothetical protein